MMSVLLLCCTLFAAGAGDPQPVVVYTALDRIVNSEVHDPVH